MDDTPRRLPGIRTYAQDLERERAARGDEAVRPPHGGRTVAPSSQSAKRKRQTGVANAQGKTPLSPIPPPATAASKSVREPAPLAPIPPAAPRTPRPSRSKPTETAGPHPAPAHPSPGPEQRRASEPGASDLVTDIPPFHRFNQKAGAERAVVVDESDVVKPISTPAAQSAAKQKRHVSATPQPHFDIDDNPDSADATVITDTRRNRFQLIPALIKSVREWFQQRQLSKQRQTPTYTVPDAQQRKRVIQTATSNSGRALHTDSRELRERIRRRQRSTEPSRPKSERRQLPKPTLPHTFWTPYVESTYPLLEDADETRDTPATEADTNEPMTGVRNVQVTPRTDITRRKSSPPPRERSGFELDPIPPPLPAAETSAGPDATPADPSGSAPAQRETIPEQPTVPVSDLTSPETTAVPSTPRPETPPKTAASAAEPPSSFEETPPNKHASDTAPPTDEPVVEAPPTPVTLSAPTPVQASEAEATPERAEHPKSAHVPAENPRPAPVAPAHTTSTEPDDAPEPAPAPQPARAAASEPPAPQTFLNRDQPASRHAPPQTLRDRIRAGDTNTLTILISAVLIILVATFFIARTAYLVIDAQFTDDPIAAVGNLQVERVSVSVPEEPALTDLLVQPDMSQFELIFVDPDTDEPLSGRTLVDHFDLSLPGDFAAAVTDLTVAQHERTHPALVIGIRNVEAARGGLLEWEPRLTREVLRLLGERVSAQAPVATRSFADGSVAGYDVRYVTDENASVRLLYGFANENTVIIATDEEAFATFANQVE